MSKYTVSILFLLFTSSFIHANAFSDTTSVLGRWDITVNISGNDRPSWLEIHKSGIRILVGEFVADGGALDPYQESILKMVNLVFQFLHNGSDKIKT